MKNKDGRTKGVNLNSPFYLVQINNQPRYKDPVAGGECVCEARKRVFYRARQPRTCQLAKWYMYMCRM